MALPNFGIPDTDEAIAAVRQAIDANHTALSSAYQALGEPVVATINNNDTALSLVQSALRTAVRRKVGTFTRQLNKLPAAAYPCPDSDPPVDVYLCDVVDATGKHTLVCQYVAADTPPPAGACQSVGRMCLSNAQGYCGQFATQPVAASPVAPGVTMPPAPSLPVPGNAALPYHPPEGVPVPVSIPSPWSRPHPPPHRPAHPLDTAEGTARVLGFMLPGVNPHQPPTPQPPPPATPPPQNPPQPPVDDGLPRYYVICGAQGPGAASVVLMTATQAASSRYLVVAGPYDIEQNALDVALANNSGTRPICPMQPVSQPPPIPPIDGPPPPPPPVPPISTDTSPPPPPPPECWYYYCATTSAGLSAVVQQFPCGENPGSPWSGPYSTRAAAQTAGDAACHVGPPAAHGQTCLESTGPVQGYPSIPVDGTVTTTADDVCTRYELLRVRLIDIGRGIIGYGPPFRLIPDVAANILHVLMPSTNLTGTDSLTFIHGLQHANWSQGGTVDDSISALLTFFRGTTQQSILSLMAVRAYLVAMQDAKIELSGGFAEAKAGRVEVGIGGESGIPGASTNYDESCEATGRQASSIATFLVFGIETVEQLIAAECPQELPGAGECIEAYLRDQLTKDQLACLLRLNGCDHATWQPIVDGRREQLTAPEYIQWARRHGLPVETQAALIRRLGWTNPEEAAARVELYDELPTVADFLHFITRNVYDTDYVRDYQLDEGFEDRMWTNYGSTLEAIGLNKRWAKEHYRAHWITASPGQLREMVHRLRPDKPGVQNPVTTLDFERLLAEQDIAPWIRRRFVETVYNVPALSYIVEMFRNYTVNDEELRSVHLDLGFSPQDAERFLAVDKLRRSRMRAAEAHGWTPPALAKAYISGQITSDQVTAEMAAMGYTAAESERLRARAGADLAYTTFTRARSRAVFAALSEIRTSLAVGVMDGQTAVQTLLGMGWPTDFASGWVNVQTASARVAIVRQGVSVIRGSYYRGEATRDQAAVLLGQLGIVPDMITQYLSLWAVRLTKKRKTLSKAEIMKELCSGHIGTGDAIARLSNLGYDGGDIELYLADAGQCIAQRRAKAESLAARQSATESRELLKLEKEAKAQAHSLLKEAERAEPVSKLVKWAAMGEIDAPYFCRRMRRYGYDNDEIKHYWSEAVARKGSQADPAAISDCLQQRSRPEPGAPNATGP